MTTSPTDRSAPVSGPSQDQHLETSLGRDAREESPGRGFSPRMGLLLGGIALVTIVLVVTAGSFLGLFGPRQEEGLVFVIPAGIDVERPGFDSAIAIPTDIRFKAGEPAVITVRNLDDETQRAGPFLVGPGQTYVQRFPEPGRYPIACSVDPLESIVVTVDA